MQVEIMKVERCRKKWASNCMCIFIFCCGLD